MCIVYVAPPEPLQPVMKNTSDIDTHLTPDPDPQVASYSTLTDKVYAQKKEKTLMSESRTWRRTQHDKHTHASFLENTRRTGRLSGLQLVNFHLGILEKTE